MIARRSVWSNSEVKKLAENFIPVADEVWRLQSGQDPESRLFQSVAELGHYGGRTFPTNTRQGTYIFAPSGEFLTSFNSNDPTYNIQHMQKALAKWNTLTKEQRLGPDRSDQTAQVIRLEAKFPKDGLVLRVFSRDMPREDQAQDWRGTAWNQDYLWFNAAEAKQFVPGGSEASVPERLVRRMVQLNFVDNVRGQTPPFGPEDVKKATLTVKETSRKGSVVSLRFEGETEAEEVGTWSIEGLREASVPKQHKRGIRTKMLGYADFDLRKMRFTRFELAAVGDRWGATQYNVRYDDMGPARIGFFVRLAGDRPEERIAPSNWWGYHDFEP